MIEVLIPVNLTINRCFCDTKISYILCYSSAGIVELLADGSLEAVEIEKRSRVSLTHDVGVVHAVFLGVGR